MLGKFLTGCSTCQLGPVLPLRTFAFKLAVLQRRELRSLPGE